MNCAIPKLYSSESSIVVRCMKCNKKLQNKVILERGEFYICKDCKNKMKEYL